MSTVGYGVKPNYYLVISLKCVGSSTAENNATKFTPVQIEKQGDNVGGSSNSSSSSSGSGSSSSGIY